MLRPALLLLTILSSAPDHPDGKILFENHCARCHGNDGARGLFGARNLRRSRLNDDELFRTISNGKAIMPRWKKKLNPEQISAVIVYIKTLRN